MPGELHLQDERCNYTIQYPAAAPYYRLCSMSIIAAPCLPCLVQTPSVPSPLPQCHTGLRFFFANEPPSHGLYQHTRYLPQLGCFDDVPPRHVSTSDTLASPMALTLRHVSTSDDLASPIELPSAPTSTSAFTQICMQKYARACACCLQITHVRSQCAWIFVREATRRPHSCPLLPAPAW